MHQSKQLFPKLSASAKGDTVELGEFYPMTVTNLPGLEGIKIIDARPTIIKENSSKPVKQA